MFLDGFLPSCISENGNEYSTKKLQNLQLYPNCVSTLPDKTAHYEVTHRIFYKSSAN